MYSQKPRIPSISEILYVGPAAFWKPPVQEPRARCTFSYISAKISFISSILSLFRLSRYFDHTMICNELFEYNFLQSTFHTILYNYDFKLNSQTSEFAIVVPANDYDYPLNWLFDSYMP